MLALQLNATASLDVAASEIPVLETYMKCQR